MVDGPILPRGGGERFDTTQSGVPAGLPLGWWCAVIQGGAGQMTFAAAGGVIVASRQGFTKTAGQYALVSLLHIRKNAHILLGDAG